MAAACGLTLIKKFTYRGDATEEYSNTYWLTGAAPANTTDWRTLFDAVKLAERSLFRSTVSIIRGYGYNDDTGHKTGDTGPVAAAVWSVDLTVSPNSPQPGNMSGAASTPAPGDCAVWVRWKTSRLNSKGKPIYLRKYYHPAEVENATTADTVSSTWKTNADTFGTKMQDGTLPNGRTLTAAGHTDVLVGHGYSNYITTRTLHRRGKRPGS